MVKLSSKRNCPAHFNTPPGQFITEKFPVLTFGKSPEIYLNNWEFTAYGLVNKQIKFNWSEFTNLKSTKITAQFHCVTQWSRLENTWEGIPFSTISEIIQPKPNARFAMVHCYGGYSTNLELSSMLESNVLLAYKHDNQPLTTQHGGPMRLVIPNRYGWKSAKWVKGIELMEQNAPGFWESRGYHMYGDPWKEQRFQAD